MDDRKLQELKNQHGELLAFEVEGQAVAFRRPTRADYKRFKMEVMNEKTKATATDNLAFSCLVHPERTDFNAIVDRWPSLIETASVGLVEMIGSEDQFQKKIL